MPRFSFVATVRRPPWETLVWGTLGHSPVGELTSEGLAGDLKIPCAVDDDDGVLACPRAGEYGPG